MNKLIKFVWMVSVLIFLMLLLWVYFYLPEQVELYNRDSGLDAQKVSRQTMFYLSLAVFAISNLTLYTLSKLVKVMPKGNSPLLANSTMALRLEGWTLSFSWAINLCYMFVLIYLGLFNNPDSFKFSGYSYLLIYTVPVIILIWLLALAVLLLRRA